MIEKLSSRDIDCLRVALFAVSLAQVTAELVQNAVDAGPASVEILINVPERSVEVRDDGAGIAPEDFQLLGQR
ncbi:UNVERIFIED_CONTAM: DNA mismatch repair protein [Siphonaria sp. JEL0065]|nr:DNA mismatch repair protein [Siphonaria sp. JEL0065]